MVGIARGVQRSFCNRVAVEAGVFGKNKRFGKDPTVAQYEKRIGELEQLLGREISLLRNFVAGSSC
ncbi:hypothetical protein LM599_00505 [Candidatus Acetothermia bacterium]|nr:hypothetical protein [Candidatus Acetothermia bacterium]MCI2429013.1 hypothetical protein [Candidatus Acetothermia bacterium]